MTETTEKAWIRHGGEYPSLPNPIGRQVFTHPSEEGGASYTEEGRRRRRSAVGTVVNYSNSHGLCYKVEHAPGDHGWYEPTELVRLVLRIEPEVVQDDPPKVEYVVLVADDAPVRPVVAGLLAAVAEEKCAAELAARHLRTLITQVLGGPGGDPDEHHNLAAGHAAVVLELLGFPLREESDKVSLQVLRGDNLYKVDFIEEARRWVDVYEPYPDAFTLGRASSYDPDLTKNPKLRKLGKSEGYDGGWVWPTAQAAAAFRNSKDWQKAPADWDPADFEVYALRLPVPWAECVSADPDPSDGVHRLLRDARILHKVATR